MPFYLKCLRWLLAVSIMVMLLMPAQLCISIYNRSDTQMNQSAGAVFVRENVVESLAPFGYALVINAVLATVVCVMQRRYDVCRKPLGLTPANRLRLVKSRTGAMPAQAQAEERKRLVINVAAAMFAVGCLLPGCIFMLRGENFVSWDMEQVMGDVVVNVLPGVAAVMCIMCARSYLCDKSMLREAEILRNCPAAAHNVTDVKLKLSVNGLRVAIFVAAAVLIVYGITNGGLRDVLVKAINICTECIGLG